MRNPVVIAPEGELDLARVGEFRLQLFEAARDSKAGLVVDFTHVSFIDSSGITVLLDLQHRFLRLKRQLAIVAPRGSIVAVVLGLTGLWDRLPVYETREAAVEA